jgi:hypothetical protein
MEERGPEFVKRRLLTAAMSAGLWLAAYIYAPHAQSGPVLCPFHGLIGLPCPSCGLTRAMCALVSGDVAGALKWNALVVPVALLLAAAPVVAMVELAAGREARFYRRILFSRRAAEMLAVGVVVYHLARSGAWLMSGVLAEQFWRTSWSYRLFERFFGGSG